MCRARVVATWPLWYSQHTNIAHTYTVFARWGSSTTGQETPGDLHILAIKKYSAMLSLSLSFLLRDVWSVSFSVSDQWEESLKCLIRSSPAVSPPEAEGALFHKDASNTHADICTDCTLSTIHPPSCSHCNLIGFLYTIIIALIQW